MPTQDLLDFLMAFGQIYEPAMLPKEVQRGRIGHCFDNCIMAALRSKHLRYVEGVASDPSVGNEVWILHAWLTDGVRAYDPTWRAKRGKKEVPLPAVYLGIEMDKNEVAKFMIATEYAGVLANGWRDKKRANAAIGKEWTDIMKLDPKRGKEVSYEPRNIHGPDHGQVSQSRKATAEPHGQAPQAA